ncbi:urea carboxylase [Actinoplanes campanulatus]|uniref:Urea carboxylase n=1 Tax=Actinoplanes campanulatus TaxID=113559 RepID=A0A7W5AS09_9ACTN|nr:5-oxoprolinase/urea amidolyase family protein [Actinoplanes campanulatus]MBB3101220.1 urea carboxylase [Actinoplanes campanulatus]GGN51950.1 urea carboxylase [Actinoplanes campanulatus]GID41967.1 urea carboxylase [Actinoplanes campanulatus]
MFDTLLVANRGEIACRIIRTAARLGVKTVAVFSEPDRGAPHVRMADQAVLLGPAPARESYLLVDRVLGAALSSGAGAVHPGYGFLSEDAGFATAVEAAGLAFVGPTPAQLTAFGAKHTARELARAAGVPMIEGTGLLAGLDEALAEADRIGYPVMVKATGGGGGIGMQAVFSPRELADAFGRVERMAVASFGSGGVFLERFVQRARHVEVQVFGDGAGRVVALGDRDCSLQRRNQKVLEEAPAPGLPSTVRERLHESAVALCASVNYRSAGTVEFVYDAEREEASFLEVNARLQVEHPVTEEVLGVDLVAWMLRLAQGEDLPLERPVPRGAAVEARVYAEDPTLDHRPSAGLITNVTFPANVRVDGWIEAGTEVSTSYDPMLAKVIATGATRDEAYANLRTALAGTRIDGIETNLGLLRAATADPTVLAARHCTATLAGVHDTEPRIVVERAGTLTTVQDWPGRTGLWEVGVPPSGPMDDLSFRLGNQALGNPEGAPGLECTVDGPALRFTADATVCVTGAPVRVTVDGAEAPCWEPVRVPAGAVLDIGRATGGGLRVYVLFNGGLDVPRYLGSAATFTLGQFGGHGGRALRLGDVVRTSTLEASGSPVPLDQRPDIRRDWRIKVTEGPHAAPEFFTRDDIDAFYAASFEVHFNSARTGVRLVGPKPRWARTDGGEAGLHPSNIHDTPYSVGAVDFTGDVPILLGPDGPSLGGFVCPATVITSERWKLGQLAPGDTVRFVPVNDFDFEPLIRAADDGVLARTGEVTYRRSGDDNLLVEYGPMTLDLGLRMRAHALMDRLRAEGLGGVVDLTPGIRSLQIHVDPARLPVRRLLGLVRSLEDELPATRDLVVPSRTVHLPLSWDDPATREAIARYINGVRDDAPWCPWNIEFIRRVNGLDSVDDVHRTVYDASYLVLGLGDVYLGAPVATPLDPRHRLVTTKYNPARTWTPENAVGIGGAYLCIYGMEGPGGYQFVGRTVQVWSRWQRETGDPWLLRHFDRIHWYPVGAEELLDLRADVAAGRHRLRIDDGVFRLADHEAFLAGNAASIADFRARQATAFGAEREAWAAAGEFEPRPEPEAPPAAGEVTVPDGGALVEAPFVSSVWRVDVRPGDRVTAGQPLLALEAMKLETVVNAPRDGTVTDILVTPGAQVAPGSPLVVIA